ncbi:TIGR01906 family membrane protein [Glutamicibacter sp. X7]
MAEAAKDTNGSSTPASQSTTAATPDAKQQASLSQKAEKLAARLEAHKKQSQEQARTATNEQPTVKSQTPAKPTSAAPETNKPAAKEASAKPAAASATAKPAAKPAAAKAPQNKPAAAKPAAKPTAKPAAAKPAAAKPAAKAATNGDKAGSDVEDVIRAIKLPHEVQAEKEAARTAAQTAPKPAPGKPSAAGQKPVERPAEVPPVSVADSSEKTSPASAAAVAQARSRVFGSYSPEPKPSPEALKRRAARERALNSKPPLARTAQVVLSILFPLLALIAAVRLVATPLFLALAYGRPGFPSDAYGFTDEQRLTYGSYGVDFLNNFAGPEFLSGLKFSTGSTMFTDGEVQHMVDVKNLMGMVYVGGAILAVLAIICIVYLARRYAGGVRRSCFTGAILLLAVIAALAVAAVLGWNGFFSSFHALFFTEGTWTFNVTDTLIRLYPEQFWIDSAITVAALVVLCVVITLSACWPTARRREASRLRQDARVFGLGG